MSTNAFTIMGNTVRITANTAAPNATRVDGFNSQGFTSYRVANPEANETIFYTLAADGLSAKANANLLADNPYYPLPAGAVEVVTGPARAYFSGVTRTAAANLYVTPGVGM